MNRSGGSATAAVAVTTHFWATFASGSSGGDHRSRPARRLPLHARGDRGDCGGVQRAPQSTARAKYLQARTLVLSLAMKYCGKSVQMT